MPDWQTIATLIALAAAGAFLVRRLFWFISGRETGSCGSCSSNATGPKSKTLVPLELPDQRR
jgi:hypothetical protein